ncbi:MULTISPECIES: glycosyltransferase family 4 protein [Methylotenera]|uniref:glycosyltransferase family 4 protein n=1 Tax=Methylotenera TaxID=359407 RepID=UPI0003788B48|nr:MULTISPECIES: glycosyltransferase family 4 protein [Methylotenera]
MRNLKILIVCEHASNIFGGEAMLPLNYFRYLAKTQHEVYLITHARVKTSVSKLADINQENVFYIPDTAAHKFLNKCGNLLPERISILTVGFVMHLITQFYQWKLARNIVKEKEIDVIHEPAPVSAVQPSAMFALGIPVVIGPMNGGMSFPIAFKHMAGKSERILYHVIRVFSSIYNLLIPGKFFAKYLLVANQRTHDALPKFRLGKVVEIVENGVFSVVDAPKEASQPSVINVLFVGRLVDWKAIDILIDAISQCQAPVKLTILGDGVLRSKLEQYAQRKAPNKVLFLGLVSHAETNDYYDKADIFVLPSIRECGGAVVLEAMSRGLPVVATAWGGPMDYITNETGYLVEPQSREYMVEQFSSIIDKLALDPHLRYQLGQAAIARIKQHFLWDKKTQEMITIYKKVVGDLA